MESGLIDPKVNVPALLVMGEEDYCFKFPGMEEYIRSGVVKHFVPDLEIIYIPEGRHFLGEQFPEKVNKLIIEFLDKQSIWLWLWVEAKSLMLMVVWQMILLC